MHILFTNIHTPNLYKVKGRCNKFGYNVWTKNIHSFRLIFSVHLSDSFRT